jgi:hypothetical protein
MNSLRIITATCIFSFFIGCAPATQFLGHSRDRDIVIDGSATEWDDVIEYPAHIIPNLGMGAVSDNDHLYLCLTSEDRSIVSKILMAGFSITFQTPKQNKSLFGIYFPLGMKDTGSGPLKHDPEEWAAQLESSLQMIALLGPGNKDTTFMPVARAESLGMAMRINAKSMENFTYELKVPLTKTGTSPYAVLPGRDYTIVVTLESGVLKRPQGRHQRSAKHGPPGDQEEPDGDEGGMPPRDNGQGLDQGSHFGSGGFWSDAAGMDNMYGPRPGMNDALKATFTLKLYK